MSNAEYQARLKELRQHPFVVQWIKDYQKDDKWRQYKDCRHCGYPHAESLICGRGSTFGELRIGHDTYYVDQSNVNWFVGFREQPMEGFHWRNDIFFKRLADCVEITSFWQYNNSPQKRVWRIPHPEWASIVCSVSTAGETLERWEASQEFHGRSPTSANEQLSSTGE